jgi:hypothetical protein
MRAAVAERRERRRWKAWAVLEHDETLYRVSLTGPEENPSIRQLLDLGWFAIPVDVVEREP